MCGGFAAIGIYSCPANNPITTTVRIDWLEGVGGVFVRVAILFRLAMATVHLERLGLAELYTDIFHRLLQPLRRLQREYTT